MNIIPDEAVEMVRLSNATLTEIFYPKDGRPFQFRFKNETEIIEGERVTILKVERITYLRIGNKIIPQISVLSNDYMV